MDGTELELLRETYRQLKKAGFHQRRPEEKARLDALFKRLAGFLKDGDRESGKQGSRETGRGGQAVEGKPGLDSRLTTHDSRFTAQALAKTEPEREEKAATQVKELVLNVDGASKGNPGRAGAGGVLSTPEGEEVESFSLYLGERTNNEAEYMALIEGLKRASKLRPEKLVVRSDSLLLVKQMRGEFKVKKYELVKLHLEARRHFPCKGIRFEHVPRERNAEADRLAGLGAASGLDSPEPRA